MRDLSGKICALGLGADFPKDFVEGFWERYGHLDPASLARIEIVVNTTRMKRRLIDLFDEGRATLLPRISLVTEIGTPVFSQTTSPLKSRLELVQLIAQLLEQQPDLAARDSLFDLADSLSGLMKEMRDEGVDPSVFETLDVEDESGHWRRALAFLNIVQHFFGDTGEINTPNSNRDRVQALIDQWETNPPKHPIIVAGSTGSRGTTSMFMQAVAQLPEGRLVLPGFDFEQPVDVWDRLQSEKATEDHPQFRFAKLLSDLGTPVTSVENWAMPSRIDNRRSSLISLALRPAPITDQWMEDGPSLGEIDSACEGMTLVQAQSPREEALCIAARIRQAVEEGETTALITPDRSLTRQVEAALDRWHIVPDDSAGTPLALTATGRFLLQTLDVLGRDLSFETLLALLKNPITNSGGKARGDHLRFTRDFELYTRRNGPPFPTSDTILQWAASRDAADALVWGQWLANAFTNIQSQAIDGLDTFLDQHLKLSEAMASGHVPDPENTSGILWKEKQGIEAAKWVAKLQADAHEAGQIPIADYRSIFRSVLNMGEVRDRDLGHPQVLFWGTLEARVQGADLVILAGMNEGSWPESPSPDPWLNRNMRKQAGLLLPERRIGLSAHDFQQAICRPKVWITRSIRSSEAETVPSRWVNRLVNLLRGLPEQNGPELLSSMIDRGQSWLDKTRRLEATIDPVSPEPRPSPQPPVTSRPRQLSVTRFKTLVRDPFAIYAQSILRLRPLDPMKMTPDAPLRGIVIHRVLERFLSEDNDNSEASLRHILNEELQDKVPWPVSQRLWKARFEKVIPWFIDLNDNFLLDVDQIQLEARGKMHLSDIDFTITGTADRIDIDANGQAVLFDYKTGKPPSKKEQEFFDRQLLIETAMVEEGSFENVGPTTVTRADYIGLGSNPALVSAPLDKVAVSQILSELRDLLGAYDLPEKGYTARSKMQKSTDVSDYDHLSRYGEWDDTDLAVPVILE